MGISEIGKIILEEKANELLNWAKEWEKRYPNTPQNATIWQAAEMLQNLADSLVD